MLLDHAFLHAAMSAATRSVALAEPVHQSALVTIGNAVLGSALLAGGRPAEAWLLLAAYDVEPGWIARWAPRLVEADLALGDVGGARSVAPIAPGRWPPRVRFDRRRAAAERAGSMVAFARGNPSPVLRGSLCRLLTTLTRCTRSPALARVLAARALASSDTRTRPCVS